MFSSLLLAVGALALGVQGQGKWEFYAYSGLPGMLSYGRLDPIISPGKVSAHVHQIQGANAMASTYSYHALRAQSTCTTIQVQDDLSNYWAPAMYHYDGHSSYTLMLANFHVYYRFLTKSYDPDNAAGSSKVYPFPIGLTMLAGNMMQRSINHSDPVSTASVFQCQRSSGGSPYSHDIRDFQRDGKGNCQQALRATTNFPSCWDGVADNSDRTHVVYPNGRGVCPQSHPKALMNLLFEWYWPVQNFPFDPKRDDNWVLSFGDTTGMGFHGDFVNGWNIDLLQSAINSCNVEESGIEHCNPFSAYQHQQIPPCMPSGLYPNENVGLNGQVLTSLPGCNPLWKDNSTKATCPNAVDPPINLQWGPDLSSWNQVSCPFAYTSKGEILTAKHQHDWANMTADSCLAFCKGYKYALMTWGDICLCDNEIQNGGSAVSDPNYACQVRCGPEYLQFCGGFGSGVLFEACTGSACHANAAFPKTAATTVRTIHPPVLPAQSTGTYKAMSSPSTTHPVTTSARNAIASSSSSACKTVTTTAYATVTHCPA